jgi:polysaccharide deacetylase 2 family uncharacterized protein YibQ
MKKNILIVIIVGALAALSALVFTVRIFLRPKEVAQAKVAIIIDDWGYNLRHLNLIKEIEVPITISILPNLRYSKEIARFARAQGKEVILHLPLEPEEIGRSIGLEKYTITTAMTREEVLANLSRALSSVPGAKGISNHMGSRATKDPRLMSQIFAELKKRRLFFLDNVVTDKSICAEYAKDAKIKFAARNVFLDNRAEKEYIRGQLNRLQEFSLIHKEAVGIAHAKFKTLKVLKDEIARMQNEGIEFVFVSELAR